MAGWLFLVSGGEPFAQSWVSLLLSALSAREGRRENRAKNCIYLMRGLDALCSTMVNGDVALINRSVPTEDGKANETGKDMHMTIQDSSSLCSSCCYSDDNDPLYQNRIRLLQTDPERYFKLFPPPKLRFGSLGQGDS